MELRAESGEQRVENREHRAGTDNIQQRTEKQTTTESREYKTQICKQRVENKEKKTRIESREQGAERKEQKAEIKEQRTEKRADNREQ